MTNKERDTHFQGFAKLLWHEIRKTSFDSPGFSEYQQLERHLQLLIAQYAYDLVKFVLENTNATTLDSAMRHFDSAASRIPDLTEWPTTVE